MKIEDHYCPKHKIRMIRKMNMWRDNSYFVKCPVKDCEYTATEHNFGHVLSFAANKYTKSLRFEAHSLAYRKFNGKEELYLWLKHNSKKQHIGYMFSRELKKLIVELKKLPDLVTK